MLYLIDASVFIFRAWHAIPETLTDSRGRPVNAVYGFGRFLGDLLERVRPEHIGIAFDARHSDSFRSRLYPAYKANRQPVPEALKRQFALCRELCEALGTTVCISNGHEADDVIGTLATRLRTAGKPVVIVTRDKDLSQLIRPGDHYWDYINDQRFGYDAIAGRFGVQPERMACFLAVMGDAADNIPGVPGVGRKTASILFQHFESLLRLYRDLDLVSRLRLRNARFVAAQLREHRATVLLAHQLTAIVCDIPMQVSLADLACRRPDLAAVNAFCDDLGFGRLLRDQAARLAGRS